MIVSALSYKYTDSNPDNYHMDRDSFESALDEIADDLSDWIFDKVKGWLQHAGDTGEANEERVKQIIRQIEEARP
mgnify:CR=1 FL=1